jgi:ABC-type multidrug transport system ATPase subunit
MVFLDEPLSGLDRQSSENLFSRIREYCVDTPATVVMTVPDTPPGLFTGLSVACISEGTLRFLSSPDGTETNSFSPIARNGRE